MPIHTHMQTVANSSETNKYLKTKKEVQKSSQNKQVEDNQNYHDARDYNGTLFQCTNSMPTVLGIL